MAFQHIALLRFPRDLTADELQWADRLIAGWPGLIPGIQTLSWGQDVSGRSQGFQFGIVIRFESRDHAAAYQPHPRHQEFATWAAERGAEVLAFDFPIPAS
jgi:hypothetical protein